MTDENAAICGEPRFAPISEFAIDRKIYYAGFALIKFSNQPNNCAIFRRFV